MVDKMSIISDILKDEYERLQLLEKRYAEQLKTFPKGAPSKRQRSGRYYLYLVFRENKKVVTQYVGKVDSDRARAVMQQVSKRKEIEKKLRRVRQDLKDIERTLK